jgi:chromatin structure-remodeling complex subunit RSC58
VLQTKIPSAFYEAQPTLIGKSFLEYIANKDDFPFTSVYERLNAKYYKSVYQLYHDIRLSAFILLHQLDIGSDVYVDIDRYYKFSTEFIMRESFRLNLQVNDAKQIHQTTDDEDEISDFDQLLSQDFLKISTSYTFGNQEAYYLTTQGNIPLFSSSNQRSALDERELSYPDKFSTTKILPHTYAPRQNILSSVSPLSNRIAQLSDQQQSHQILSTFLHPNWYSLPTAKWLEQSDFLSFAPVIDEQNTVVSSTDKARLWLEHVGYKKVLNSIDHQEKKTNGHEDVTKADLEVKAEDRPKQEVQEQQIEVGQISLENLYEWAPGNEIGEDEIEAFENGTESQLVNELLKKLYTLRELRIANGLEKPNLQEIQLYHKVNRVLVEIINASEQFPDIKPSDSIPILQTEYTGTLPVPTQTFTKKKNKSRR